eukprot:TRINITY_DN61637_c0_g1_i1.p1 TRINITY_DN61637_c0_g1~~TRINITY_DN61637_c0_g1_i1.p1  ORF type:complete len:933 (+),score=138.48 TRINITY_DN61637_c0_g1_i1:76-2874(+)
MEGRDEETSDCLPEGIEVKRSSHTGSAVIRRVSLDSELPEIARSFGHMIPLRNLQRAVELVRRVSRSGVLHHGLLLVLGRWQPSWCKMHVRLQGFDQKSGRELQEHLQGKTLFDEEVSEYLIRMATSPHEHDGAVGVSRHRGKMQLPRVLFEELPSLHLRELRLGARHTTALQLAVMRSCVCIVLSEETSQLSLIAGTTIYKDCPDAASAHTAPRLTSSSLRCDVRVQVEVFSKTAKAWLPACVAHSEKDGHLTVEFQLYGHRCRKRVLNHPNRVREPRQGEQAGASESYVEPAPWRLEELRGHALRSLSIDYLKSDFLHEVHGANFESTAAIYDLEPVIIRPRGESKTCPRDGEIGAAYVDCIDDPGKTGIATHMLSYTWAYSVEDIVSTLACHCEQRNLHPKQTFAWICCFCVNQHRVKSKGQVPFAHFEEVFRKRVVGIGRIIAMISPWDRPLYLTRAWCIFEVYTAIVSEIEADIAMPRHGRQCLRNCLLQGGAGLHLIWRAFASVKVEDAQASVQKDLKNIKLLIKNGKGFEEVNQAVSTKLKSCFLDALEIECTDCLTSGSIQYEDAVKLASAVCTLLVEFSLYDRAEKLVQDVQRLRSLGKEECPQDADLLLWSGQIRKERGQLDDAEDLFQRASDLHVRTGTAESPEHASVLHQFGVVLSMRGNYKGALEQYYKAMHVRRQTQTMESIQGAALLQSMGIAFQICGDHDEALALYEQSSGIIDSLGEVTLQKADTLHSIGIVKRLVEDYEGSLEAFREEQEIRKQTLSFHTVKGAVLRRDQAVTLMSWSEANGHSNAQKLSEAKALLDQCLQILEKTGAMQSSSAALAMQYIGKIRYWQGDNDGALEALHNARRIRQATKTMQSAAVADIFQVIGWVQEGMGNQHAAWAAYKQAEGIRRSTSTMNTPEGKLLAADIARATLNMHS